MVTLIEIQRLDQQSFQTNVCLDQNKCLRVSALEKRGMVGSALLFEPSHDKTNKVACAPSKDSDQPGHPTSLIRVFTVRTEKHWVLSYPLSAQQRL